MAFPLEHWNNPRHTIASRYEDNDFAYVTHGAKCAMQVLTHCNILASEAKHMTILDYGCGTGRTALFLSYYFGKVIGYDPNEYCIQEALKENEKSDVRKGNLIFTSDLKTVPKCHLAYSINVIEHLPRDTAFEMIANLKEKVNDYSLLWYSPKRNKLLEPYIISSPWDADNKHILIDKFKF